MGPPAWRHTTRSLPSAGSSEHAQFTSHSFFMSFVPFVVAESKTVEVFTEKKEWYSKEPAQFSPDSFPLSASTPDYIQGHP